MKRLVTIELPKEPCAVPPMLLSLEQAAEAMSLSRTFLCLLIKDGSLRSIKIGKRRLIPVTEIQAFARRGVTGA